jgi:hypothetical protein
MAGTTGGYTPTTSSTRTSSTDSGVCAISPSDLVGYTGNLINRVKELEQRVAELEAANVEVNQLSDLSQQVGWASVTYLGQAGWKQTEYGTLIPPAGWSFLGAGMTLSDGNTYQGVFYDEDGVLQFGFNKTTGTVTGASMTGKNYVTFNTLICSPGNNIDFGTVSITSGSFYTWNGSDTITFVEKGVYALNLIVKGASSDIGDGEYFQAIQQFGYPFSFHSSGAWSAVVDADGSFLVGATNFMFVTTVPSTFVINWHTTNAGDGITQGSLQVVKLMSIT